MAKHEVLDLDRQKVVKSKKKPEHLISLVRGRQFES
jgi:hypothetical protein